MSILDLDNEQTLDISAQRLGINADSNARQGELFNVYASKAFLVDSKQYQQFIQHFPKCMLAIEENGTLTSGDTIYIKDDKPSLYPLFENGVINCIQVPYFAVEQVAHLSNKHVGKGICCGEFLGMGLDIVSGIHIDIHHMFDGAKVFSNEPNHRNQIHNGVTFQYAYRLDDSVKFEDTEINFDPLVKSFNRYIRFSSYSQQPSSLKGLRSNCNKIVIYTLDDFPSELWNIFEPHDCLVIDSNEGCSVRIPIKTMKKAVAIANNPRRYTLREHILKLKPGARLADILPVENFPELELFIVENNNVRLTFVNSAFRENFEINYARVPPEKMMKPARWCYPKTADGWYVVMSNKI